jgi:hypothetical protein
VDFKLVTVGAVDVKKITQRQLPLAVIDDERPYFGVRARRENVGRNHFRFQWNGRLSFEA